VRRGPAPQRSNIRLLAGFGLLVVDRAQGPLTLALLTLALLTFDPDAFFTLGVGDFGAGGRA
jgi:hypothetical protein